MIKSKIVNDDLFFDGNLQILNLNVKNFTSLKDSLQNVNHTAFISMPNLGGIR